MKVMKYFAVASLALFAACNNEENLVVRRVLISRLM